MRIVIVLRILPVKRLPRLWAGYLSGIIITFCLTCIRHHKGLDRSIFIVAVTVIGNTTGNLCCRPKSITVSIQVLQLIIIAVAAIGEAAGYLYRCTKPVAISIKVLHLRIIAIATIGYTTASDLHRRAEPVTISI